MLSIILFFPMPPMNWIACNNWNYGNYSPCQLPSIRQYLILRFHWQRDVIDGTNVLDSAAVLKYEVPRTTLNTVLCNGCTFLSDFRKNFCVIKRRKLRSTCSYVMNWAELGHDLPGKMRVRCTQCGLIGSYNRALAFLRFIYLTWLVCWTLIG